ncbi:hypothetical protein RUND412_008764 [Rhizina undulata]
MTTHYYATDPAIYSADNRPRLVSVDAATGDDTINGVGATTDMSPQPAVASPNNVRFSSTAPGVGAQAEGHAVAKPTIRGILKPAARVLEAKIELNMGNHGTKDKPIIPVTEGVPAPFGIGVRRRSRVERAQPGPGQGQEGALAHSANSADSNRAFKCKVEFKLQGTYSVQQLKDLISVADAIAAENKTGEADAVHSLTVLKPPPYGDDLDVAANGGDAVKEPSVNVVVDNGNPYQGSYNACGALHPSGAQLQSFIPPGHPMPLNAAPLHQVNDQFGGYPPPQRPVQFEHNAVPIVEIPHGVFQGPYTRVVPQRPVVNVVQHGTHSHPVSVQSMAMEQIPVYYNGYPYQWIQANPRYYRQ